MKLGLRIALALLLTPAGAHAFCPSYTLSSASNSHACGVEAVRGTNPSPTEWQAIFALVAGGPSLWGAQGPAVADIGQGCGKPEAKHNVAARFPCEILKALAYQESAWLQFCVPDSPADQVGGASRTIISFDCGYGIGQVTSGMHQGETPAFDRQKVAGDPTYNLATGTQILAGKWRATACVGDNQPSIVEDWYTALWAYNGLAYVNNPSNPNYDASRGVWNPRVGGAAPYQEKVLGWLEHPPGNPPYWQPVAVAYPNPADVGGAGSPPAMPEPSCASPTNCVSKRSVHSSECFKMLPVDAGAGPDAGSAAPEAGPAMADASIDAVTAVEPDAAIGIGDVPPDAGASRVDGAPPIGSASADVEGGCGCRMGRSPRTAFFAWLLLGALAARRRRAR